MDYPSAAPTGGDLDQLMAEHPRRCLLAVHAHPDDEASKGPATIAHYAAAGVRCVLVCATGGEEGEILNPAMDVPEVRDNLAAIRREELLRAANTIGYHEVIWLGYRDSGMAGSVTNDNPDCFARADLVEAVGRLVAIIRRERPQVVITYADDQEGYPHPDHLRVHDISRGAFDASGDPNAYLDAGAAWQPDKLYYSAWSRARLLGMHQRFLDAGLESPFTDDWLARAGLDSRITTHIAVPNGEEIRRQALLAHATQIDPASPFWFGASIETEVGLTDDYILAASHVEALLPENDLFGGI